MVQLGRRQLDARQAQGGHRALEDGLLQSLAHLVKAAAQHGGVNARCRLGGQGQRIVDLANEGLQGNRLAELSQSPRRCPTSPMSVPASTIPWRVRNRSSSQLCKGACAMARFMGERTGNRVA